jgi:multicomponent K+:H+ antiporter subunit E
MNRVLPYPVLSVSLLAMWLLLNGAATPAVLLSGAALALAAPLVLVALEASPLRLRGPVAIVQLTATVLYDIVRSNIAVARIIYGERRDTRASGFVEIPLDLTNRYGLAVLATIITCTPGTLWVQHDSARGRLLMHIFDLVEPEHWVTLIKQRYERLLLEIFK